MTKAEKEYGRIRNEIFPFPPGAYMTHSIVPRCSTVNETADEASPVTLYNHKHCHYILYVPIAPHSEIFSLRPNMKDNKRVIYMRN